MWTYLLIPKKIVLQLDAGGLNNKVKPVQRMLEMGTLEIWIAHDRDKIWAYIPDPQLSTPNYGYTSLYYLLKVPLQAVLKDSGESVPLGSEGSSKFHLHL